MQKHVEMKMEMRLERVIDASQFLLRDGAGGDSAHGRTVRQTVE